MFETTGFKEMASAAAAICLVLIALHFAFGLMTVIVAAAVFDCILRGTEALLERRAQAIHASGRHDRKRI